jgi:hypothetical protein
VDSRLAALDNCGSFNRSFDLIPLRHTSHLLLCLLLLAMSSMALAHVEVSTAGGCSAAHAFTNGGDAAVDGCQAHDSASAECPDLLSCHGFAAALLSTKGNPAARSGQTVFPEFGYALRSRIPPADPKRPKA